MQCLMTYKWVKLLRSHLPEGKGLMGYWAKLASHAAFRKGQALYCGHYNWVAPGMWSGGMVGLKRILGLKSRQSAIDVMNKLMDLGFITYTIDAKTKKLEYFLCDWIENCSGEACLGVTAYAIDQYGFIPSRWNTRDEVSGLMIVIAIILAVLFAIATAFILADVLRVPSYALHS